MTVQVDEVVATYMKLRSQKESMEAEVKDRVSTIKAKMEKLEAWIKEQADVQGVTSFKTKHGTAFLTTTDYANVADWDAVLDFIRTQEAFDMLEKRISKIAVRGYIEANKAVPPGVNYGTKLEINIRKPATRVEN
jgi:Ethanolamine utilization protein EutJ (predicted chaperonin)